MFGHVSDAPLSHEQTFFLLLEMLKELRKD